MSNAKKKEFLQAIISCYFSENAVLKCVQNVFTYQRGDSKVRNNAKEERRESKFHCVSIQKEE